MTPPRKLTAAQREFLGLLVRLDKGKGVPRCDLRIVDRKADKVRQSCRKAGFAFYAGRWCITPAGRAALEDDHG